MTKKYEAPGDKPIHEDGVKPVEDKSAPMKKVYVSAVDRTIYEVHRTAHFEPGERAIQLTDDEFVFAMRVKAEYKKLLKMVIDKYMEDEVHRK